MALYDVSTTEKKAAPSLVAGATLYADSPIGTILPYGGASAPSGWFLCDGTAVSRTTYSELFAVIGTAFGSGDGSTTFNIPDMRESVPVGSGTRGSGVADHDIYTVGQFKDDQLQEHSHYAVTGSSTAGTEDWTQFASSHVESATGTRVRGVYADGRKGTTTHGKQLGVNYIIKAKMVAMPSDFMSKVDEVVEQLHNEMDALLSADVTTTDTNYTLTSNRKLSDYDYLIVSQKDSTSVRASMIIYLNDFKARRVILSSLHGTNTSSASDYSVATVNIRYIDDTTIGAYTTGSGSINTIEIAGVKIKRR